MVTLFGCLIAQLAPAQQQSNTNSAHARSIADANAQLAGAAAEVATLREQLATCNAALKASEGVARAMHARLEDSKMEACIVSARLKGLTDDVDSLEAQVSTECMS